MRTELERSKPIAPVLLAAALSWLVAGAISAAVIRVTNTLDRGRGSLRSAIELANALPGADEIRFALPAGAAQRICPSSPLPTIVDRVTILGAGQGEGDFVELDGSCCRATYGYCPGLVLEGSGSSVDRLVVNRFLAGEGIRLKGNGGHSVTRCRLGTDASGTIELGNNLGIGVESNFNTIADNLISGNTGVGIQIDFATGTSILRNIVGPDVRGGDFHPSGAMTQWVAILTQSANETVIRDNQLSGWEAGLYLNGTQNVVLGNAIGTDWSGTRGVGTPFVGILVEGSDNQIGGPSAADLNRIAFLRPGIWGWQYGIAVNNGTGNALRGNLIHDSAPALAIDLLPLGVDPVDILDGDSGPNNAQNAPAPVDASLVGGVLWVRGYLQSEPLSYYEIDVYSTPVDPGTGSCEASAYLGATGVWTDLWGDAFWYFAGAAVPAGESVAATATAEDSADTSELSYCVQVQ